MPDPTPQEIAESLSDLELELLTGRTKGWGSWMWAVSGDLIAKGLMKADSDTKRSLTPLGEAVSVAALTKGDSR